MTKRILETGSNFNLTLVDTIKGITIDLQPCKVQVLTKRRRWVDVHDSPRFRVVKK